MVLRLARVLCFCYLLETSVWLLGTWVACLLGTCKADSMFAPSQWETALLCNDVPHWLGASLESALYFVSVRTMHVYVIYLIKCQCVKHRVVFPRFSQHNVQLMSAPECVAFVPARMYWFPIDTCHSKTRTANHKSNATHIVKILGCEVWNRYLIYVDARLFVI